MRTNTTTTSLFFLPLLVFACGAAQSPDLIKAFPGAPAGVPQPTAYSGYLNVTGTTRRLFYLLVEAAEDSASKPTLVWLNGGPGCSSLEGFFREHGPFLVDTSSPTSGNLISNPYSYNNAFNVVYLESPAGVGFSYGTSPTDYDTGDEQAASDAAAALEDLAARFPALTSQPLFVGGESYAGVYVPMLAWAVASSPSSAWKLGGIAVGNGITTYDFNSQSLVPFLAFHDVINGTLWARLDSACGGNFSHPSSQQCATLLGEAGALFNADIAAGLNPYGLYKDCAHLPSPSIDWFSAVLDGSHMLGDVTPPCYNPEPEITYLNRDDVKEALHVNPDLPPWSLCTSQLNYTKTVTDVRPYWLKLLASGANVLIYAGDVDVATNAVGNMNAVDSLGLPVDVPRQSWSARKGQLSGFVQRYSGNPGSILYATVKGAGHLVPQDRPLQALHLMTAFSKGSLP